MRKVFPASIDTLIWFHKKFIGPEPITRRTESKVPVSEPKMVLKYIAIAKNHMKKGIKWLVVTTHTVNIIGFFSNVPKLKVSQKANRACYARTAKKTNESFAYLIT